MLDDIELKDSLYMSAKDKALVLRQWKRFLKNGLLFKDFTSRLYNHLHLHCQFIAHYNREGFYATYFERGDDTVRFLGQFNPKGDNVSVEYGRDDWVAGDYADINQSMIDIVGEYIPGLVEEAKRTQRVEDVEQARVLLAKHGLSIQERK